MREIDLSTAQWHKSSHSGDEANECVEVADGAHGVVPVRDSKVVDGPVLVIGAPAWTHFINGVATVR
ncbi:DUF397 domain-containing protein [Streptomyces sp. G45]|uniref:DUF397 domain-containing protein n=1 Tax=Streptomyces sp. G45 TaxID=3406627 RepID=UPI003C16ED1F